MSQLTLTKEEDQMVLSALRSKANQYAAMFGCDDPAILDLIAKVEGQLPQPVVQADPPDVVAAEEAAEAHFAAEEVVEEKPVKVKKAK